MPLSLSQSATAVGPNCPASFLAVGGTGPFTYSVLGGGAGGSVDPTTGVYQAPISASSDPATAYDTVQVVDSLAVTATAKILVGTPLLLFCEVLQKELSLPSDHIYLWDQKLMQPTDANLYVAVSVQQCKPFGNVNKNLNGEAEQWVAMHATLGLDAISRGPAARDRKEEIILALNSVYAQQQQDACSFYIGKLPSGSRFLNLSAIDGAAIPYRYQISVALQYAYAKTKAVPYFGNGFTSTVITNP